MGQSLDFNELATLQRDINSLLEVQDVSLGHYHLAKGGFSHVYEPETRKEIFSKSSTATCVLSLTSTGHWTEKQRQWFELGESLFNELLKKKNWKSAGLKKNNPFTVAFMLEAGLALTDIYPRFSNKSKYRIRTDEGLKLLKDAILTTDKDSKFSEKGAANIEKYPPSTYLTQLVVRVLKKGGGLSEEIRQEVTKWAWKQVEQELSLIHSHSKNADTLSLAYAITIVSICSNVSEATPDQNQVLRTSVENIFAAQLPDGSWPRSRPLFHYPDFGNAYCFEYEMLAQLLQQQELRNLALNHLSGLKLAVEYLKATAFQFEDGGKGWASGHHPQLPGPESWSTASVFHFLYELDRTLAEAIRQTVFKYVGTEYLPPETLKKANVGFAEDMLDSVLFVDGKNESLKSTIAERFLIRVKSGSKDIENGRALAKNVPISAVLFGPPGTAKTRIPKEIADYLGWPLLSIDPSHLVRKGLDQVQAETNQLFSMLSLTERVVVLLDEFDEMVRERKDEHSEVISRFLTTAMLPKLTLINDRRRIVFIIATNHIDQFDFAIRRPGRFDLIVQVMPPSIDSKFGKWRETKTILDHHKISYDRDSEVENKLSQLTFAEFEALNTRIQITKRKTEVRKVIKDAYEKCTLSQIVHGSENKKTWFQLCEEQRAYIRLPN